MICIVSEGAYVLDYFFIIPSGQNLKPCDIRSKNSSLVPGVHTRRCILCRDLRLLQVAFSVGICSNESLWKFNASSFQCLFLTFWHLHKAFCRHFKHMTSCKPHMEVSNFYKRSLSLIQGKTEFCSNLLLTLQNVKGVNVQEIQTLWVMSDTQRHVPHELLELQSATASNASRAQFFVHDVEQRIA